MKINKNITLALLLTLFIQTVFAQKISKIEGLIHQLHHPADQHVMVIAHRGDWRNAPENSLLAFKQAIDMGVDVLEIDLNMTKDGVVVIMHDESIDRTTDGKGKPSDYTLEELKKFHLKEGHGVVTKHTIPTLEEVMNLAKGKALVNLDKSYPYYKEAFQVLKKTGTLQQGIFKTSATYKEVSSKYAGLLDSITFMPVVSLNSPTAKAVIDEYQKEVKPVAFEFNFQNDNLFILKDNALVKSRGAKVWVNALWPSQNGGHDDTMAWEDGNMKDSWGWLIAHGATMIQTDRPLTLLNYLRKRSMHD